MTHTQTQTENVFLRENKDIISFSEHNLHLGLKFRIFNRQIFVGFNRLYHKSDYTF